MIAPYDIVGFLQDNFQDIIYSSNEEEARVNSIFTEDHKRKLYVNTTTGLWICFKSGKKGNFIALYAAVKNIPYKRAEAELAKQYSTKKLLKPRIFEHKQVNDLELLNETVVVPQVPTGDEHPTVIKAWCYLFKRKLLHPSKRYYAGITGVLADRVVIPFEIQDIPIYFQARSLDSNKNPRYLNCQQNKKTSILYPYDTTQSSVVVCEGPIDAISLQNVGVNATAIMGSSIGDDQIKALKMFGGTIIAGFDNDEAGFKSLRYMNKKRKFFNIPELKFVIPPKDSKDWNEAVCNGWSDLGNYITANTKVYTPEVELLNSISKLQP